MKIKIVLLLQIIVLFLIFSTPFLVTAQEKVLKNVGFIPGNIWFSKIPFFAEEKIRIYTVVFNGSENDFTGAVEFYDNGNLLGKSDFSLASGTRIRDIWIDWIPLKGGHQISTKIINAKISKAGEEIQSIVLENGETKSESLLIEEDPIKIAEAAKKLELAKKEIAERNKENIQNNISNNIETVFQSISSIVVPSVKKIDDIRESTAKVLEEKVEETKKKIEENKSKEEELAKSESQSEPKKITVEKPLTYAYLALLSALKFVFNIKLLFYFALVVVFYYFLKFIFRKIFRKK